MVKSHLSVENYSQQAFYHDEIFSSLHGRNPYFYFCQVRWFASVNQVENSLRVHKPGKILSSRQAPYLSFWSVTEAFESRSEMVSARFQKPDKTVASLFFFNARIGSVF